MQRLKSAGNTLVVVEHDPQIMFAADRLLDIGPGPGERGGKIIFDGAPRELATTKDSRTAAYLLGRERINRPQRALSQDDDNRLTLTNARENNLKGITVNFPLRGLVTITGVSGSGKRSEERRVGKEC